MSARLREAETIDASSPAQQQGTFIPNHLLFRRFHHISVGTTIVNATNSTETPGTRELSTYRLTAIDADVFDGFFLINVGHLCLGLAVNVEALTKVDGSQK